jgi:hypothetical protein
VGVAEAVPGVGLPVAVAGLLEQGEGLLAGRQGVPVVAEQGVVPADVVEGVSLPGPVAGGAEQVEGWPGVAEGLGVAALPLRQLGEAVVDEALPGQVPGLAEQVEGLPQLYVRVVEAAQPDVGLGEVAVGAGLQIRVGQPPGGGQGACNGKARGSRVDRIGRLEHGQFYAADPAGAVRRTRPVPRSPIGGLPRWLPGACAARGRAGT